MRLLLAYLLLPFLLFCLSAPLMARDAAFIAPEKFDIPKVKDDTPQDDTKQVPLVKEGTREKEQEHLPEAQHIDPINFDTVEVGTERVVRTTLMINDSRDRIKIAAIDFVVPRNGLQHFDHGCIVDQELAPGESCPITLVWKPEEKGILSTDLIVRHNGKLGFTVIPIRGIAKAPEGASPKTDINDIVAARNAASVGTPTSELENILNQTSFLPTPEKTLPEPVLNKKTDLKSPKISKKKAPKVNHLKHLTLIGIVGNRAIFRYHQRTFIVELGTAFALDNQKASLVAVRTHDVDVYYCGKTTALELKQVKTVKEMTSQKTDRGNED